MTKKYRIKYFPISFFSMILGLAGFTIASQKIESLLKTSLGFSLYFLAFTIALFTILSGFYLTKIIK
ncbi:MAG: C4-dicarboxylate ABC transporter, partial [Candidatus Moranbacteria bacterium]|nr:C4-dicarboxylate ABC transporter [Candidatus Moranbacteria bacterium]